MLFGISTSHVKGKIKLLAQIDLACYHLYFTTPGKVATNLQTPKLSLFTFKVVCRTSFQISSGKLQKFTYNGVDNWCNFQLTNWRNVSFIGKEWYIYLFICLFTFCGKCGLWNMLNQRIFGILLLVLPLGSNWISKTLNGKSKFPSSVYLANIHLVKGPQ